MKLMDAGTVAGTAPKPKAFGAILKEGIMKIPYVRKRKLERLRGIRAEKAKELGEKREKTLSIARKAADGIVSGIAKGQVNAFYTDPYSGRRIHYDEPSMTGIAASQNADYAVIVIRKMIDFYEDGMGSELAYFAYKVGQDGKPVEVARKHGMLCSDDSCPDINIRRVSGKGVELEVGLNGKRKFA